MHPRYTVWLKRALAFALFASIFVVVVWAYLLIWNAPSRYSGEGTYCEVYGAGKDDSCRLGRTNCSLYFFWCLLLLPKPTIHSGSRLPRLARLFYYLPMFLLASLIGLLTSANTLAKALAAQGILPDFATHFAVNLIQVAGIAVSITYGLYRACRLSSATQAVANDSRPPFVYLRSFRDEKRYRVVPIWRGGSWWRRGLNMSPIGIPLETVLAMALEDHGPFVALRKPGQLIPVDGAARDTVDEDWKSRIVSFLKKERAVLIVPGVTGGLAWEISWLHREGMLQKVAFVMPPGPRFYRRKRWRIFCYATQLDHLVQMPPEDEAVNSVILYVKNGSLISFNGKRTEGGYRTAVARFISELALPLDNLCGAPK